MQIITATMAKGIATDYENNSLRPLIEKTMQDILQAALRGERTFDVIIPLTNISLSSALSLIPFFKGLGYKTSSWGTNGNLYFTISW